MMVMFGANGNPTAYYLCGKHEGRIGMLMGPKTYVKPRSWMPFALDNDAWIAFKDEAPWNEVKWLEFLSKVKSSGHKPLWCAVPDVVEDPEATLENWTKYHSVVAELGFTLAFVVQDGHQPEDVPESAQVIFVGGSTNWKYRSLKMWTDNFPRVHVGRVNEIRRFDTLEKLGVESCDGSGWFRDTDEGRRIMSLRAWFEKSHQQLDLIPL